MVDPYRAIPHKAGVTTAGAMTIVPLVLALAMVKLLMVLFAMVFVPLVEKMPLTEPAVAAVALLVALVKFDTMLPFMVTVPAPVL